MKIKEILDRKGREIYSIKQDMLIKEVLEILSQKKIGSLLVKDSSDQITGIITERDIVYKYNEMRKDIRELKVFEVMTPISKIITVNENDDIQNAMSIMTTKKIRHLPVISDEKKVCGILSIGDLINSLLTVKDAQIIMLQDYINGKYPL